MSHSHHFAELNPGLRVRETDGPTAQGRDSSGLPRGGAAVAGFLEQSAYPAESVPDPALGCAAHSTRGWGVAGDLLPEPARPSTGCVGGFDLTAASIRVFAVHARMEQVRAAHGPSPTASSIVGDGLLSLAGVGHRSLRVGLGGGHGILDRRAQPFAAQFTDEFEHLLVGAPIAGMWLAKSVGRSKRSASF